MADIVCISHERESKRRKVRKGTHSCWECRRRKEKCTFSSTTDPVCVRCERRGTTCVSQEIPEKISDTLEESLRKENHVARVEARVDQPCKSHTHHSDILPGPSGFVDESEPLKRRIPTAKSPLLASSQDLQASGSSAENDIAGFEILQGTYRPRENNTSRGPSRSEELKELSQRLHQLLPSSDDTERIIDECGTMSTLFFQMDSTPYEKLLHEGSLSPRRLFDRPVPTTHPVVIARYMLHVAIFLQHHQGMKGLSELPQKLMHRLADSASSLVIANDDLVACTEGLECMVKQSWYQVNGGNLRKALITIRRGMAIAQLMGAHNPMSHMKCKALDQRTKANPQFLWFRSVCIERHICMMLGLPQAALDSGMASESALENDTPMGNLERAHCYITSRILARNNSALTTQDYSLTREIDEDLQQAALKLPSKWWLAADLLSVYDKPDALFWEMRRLFHQLCHYNLLVQLHLPYMLSSSSSTDEDFDYSRIACVSAAREVLSRFLMFRSFNQFAMSCRTFDFFCLMAAMTLLLGHLDGHRRATATTALSPAEKMATSDKLLAHQRHTDRALVEQIQEDLEQVSLHQADRLSTESADLLHQLLDIESKAAGRGLVSKRDIGEKTTTGLSEDEESYMNLKIPYLGTIQITHNGLISKLPKVQSDKESSMNLSQPTPKSMDGARKPANGPQVDADEHDTVFCPENITLGNAGQDFVYPMVELTPDFGNDISSSAIRRDYIKEPAPQGLDDPMLADSFFTAGADDWAFQGVDMAFFNNLMRGYDNSGGE